MLSTPPTRAWSRRTPSLVQMHDKGADPSTEHGAKTYKLLMGSADLQLWLLPCFWLVGGRSVVSVLFCVLPCRFCFARLRRRPSFLFPCDGRGPKKRQSLSASYGRYRGGRLHGLSTGPNSIPSHQDYSFFENFKTFAITKRVVFNMIRKFSEDDLQNKSNIHQLVRYSGNLACGRGRGLLRRGFPGEALLPCGPS